MKTVLILNVYTIKGSENKACSQLSYNNLFKFATGLKNFKISNLVVFFYLLFDLLLKSYVTKC